MDFSMTTPLILRLNQRSEFFGKQCLRALHHHAAARGESVYRKISVAKRLVGGHRAASEMGWSCLLVGPSLSLPPHNGNLRDDEASQPMTHRQVSHQIHSGLEQRISVG